jgi:hypothetical protein
VYPTNAVVRLTRAVDGMPAGSEGVVLGRYTNDETLLVSFWDGGPLRVAAPLLELVASDVGEHYPQSFA